MNWRNIISRIVVLFSIVIYMFSGISCNKTPLEVLEKESVILKGRVYLQNQSEHSNCLVYLDNFNIGLCTDSSGYYSFDISQYDNHYTGTLKIYYYVREYFPDSSVVEINEGKVKNSDISIGGVLKNIELRQKLRIEGWTDKYIYKICDTLTFTARFTNLSNEKTHIYKSGGKSLLGFVTLYREDEMPVVLTGFILDCSIGEIEINAGEYYEGKVKLPILNEGSKNITPNQYIAVSSMNLEYIPSYLIKKLRKYYSLNWYKIHRGTSPKLDCAPNKHKFPIIKVIE